jgi:hypothetical protein
MSKSVFINYAPQNKDMAKRVAMRLRDLGISISVVRSPTTEPEQLKKEIGAKIKRADCVASLFSPDWVNSKRSQAEYHYAAKLNKPIVGGLLENGEVPTDFEGEYVDLSAATDEDIAAFVLFVQEELPFVADSFEDELDALEDSAVGKPNRAGQPVTTEKSLSDALLSPEVLTNILIGVLGLLLIALVAIVLSDPPAELSNLFNSDSDISVDNVPDGWVLHQTNNVVLAIPSDWVDVNESDVAYLIDAMGGDPFTDNEYWDFIKAQLQTDTMDLMLISPFSGTNVNVVVTAAPSGIDLSDLRTEMVAQLEGFQMDVEITEFVLLPAGESLKITINNSMLPGENMAQRQYYFLDDGKFYVVTLTTGAGENQATGPTFDAIIETFRIR